MEVHKPVVFSGFPGMCSCHHSHFWNTFVTSKETLWLSPRPRPKRAHLCFLSVELPVLDIAHEWPHACEASRGGFCH